MGISSSGGDPSNPMCARLTITGKLVKLAEGGSEFKQVKEWLFHRHAAMEEWPEDHGWLILKLDIEDIWFIDFFGGANVLKPEDYLNAKLDFSDVMDMGAANDSGNNGSTRTGRAKSSSQEESSPRPLGYFSLFIIVVLGSAIGNYISKSICGRDDRRSNYEEVDKNTNTLD